MVKAIGIDGYRCGWIMVWIDDAGDRDFGIHSRIESVERLKPDMVMIDIPIGLPLSQNRRCDEAARAELGKAWQRVFVGVRRPMLEYVDDLYRADNFDRANRMAKLELGIGISKQLFGILHKIKEVDQFLGSSGRRQDVFRETHPELIFQRLNDGKLLSGKKTGEGRALRKKLVAKHGFHEIDAWLDRLRGSGARVDDLLDACACAIAAWDALKSPKESSLRKLGGEVDERGLRMEMWY